MTELNKVRDVVVGEYGVPIIVELVSAIGVAIDVSSYTGTKTVTAKAPNNEATKTFTASFVSDGSDGKVKFTPASDNYFTVPGTWEGQLSLAKASTLALTVVFDIEVEKSLT